MLSPVQQMWPIGHRVLFGNICELGRLKRQSVRTVWQDIRGRNGGYVRLCGENDSYTPVNKTSPWKKNIWWEWKRRSRVASSEWCLWFMADLMLLKHRVIWPFKLNFRRDDRVSRFQEHCTSNSAHVIERSLFCLCRPSSRSLKILSVPLLPRRDLHPYTMLGFSSCSLKWYWFAATKGRKHHPN